jgi:hypothetical protein
MQASVCYNLITKPFELLFEMQHAALEINDHQVISRAMKQSFGNLIFNGFLPPFQINNMVWFCHDIPRIHA